LIEWPATDKEPTKYWLSNLPASISLRKLVAIAKLRWRIERDYEELKQELGLGHFEGRNWRGFHHHATLSIAAYGFLVLERCLFPPSGNSRSLQAADIQIPLTPHVNPATRPEALPVQTERHNPHSIATLRRQIATHLARSSAPVPLLPARLLITQ
jgi:hypothetical protein